MKRANMGIGLAMGMIGMAGCQIVANIEDTVGPDEPSPGDLSPGVIGGTALGVLVPLGLELVHDGGRETLDIDSDGPFAFETLLQPGDTYSVGFEDDTPCVIENGEGVVSDAAPGLMVVCEGAPVLTGLTISGSAAVIDIDVSPSRIEYTAEVPLLEQSASIIPVAFRPDTSITVAGTSVAGGTPSAPLPLALGDNDIEIHVAHPAGLERTYHLIIRRAPALLQHTYAKASNTGNDDRFGVSVAIDGDTMAVGAYHEDSGATGVGGGQEDDTIEDSGAVYVFRRTSASWVQEAYIKASNPGGNDLFGFSIALSGDTLAVGARYDDSPATGAGGSQGDSTESINSGAVYVFRRGSGSSWTQEAYLKDISFPRVQCSSVG